jgi:hypothetical protein
MSVPNGLMEKNVLLEKYNRKAFSRIRELEAKLNELVYQNAILTRQISEKERQEQMLENAVSNCFTQQPPSLPVQPSFALPQPEMSQVGKPYRLLYAIRVNHPPGANPVEMGMMPASYTPETAMNSDSPSEESCFNEAPNCSPFLESSCSYSENDSVLNKRRYDQIEEMNFLDELNFLHDGPSKQFCLGGQDESYEITNNFLL